MVAALLGCYFWWAVIHMFIQQIDLYEQHWLTHINSSIHLPICVPNRVEKSGVFQWKSYDAEGFAVMYRDIV